MFQNSKYYYLVYGITFIVLIVAIVFGFRFLINMRGGKKPVESPLRLSEASPVQKPAATDDATIIQQVGKHMVLPLEQPKVVTVTGVEDLRREQPFFLQAKNGDKLLVYSSRVILYNPDLDKIVDIAQIRIDTTPTPGL